MLPLVQFGVDRVIEKVPAALRRGGVGMVTSNVATTATGGPSRAALRDAGVNLVRLFGPEHGLAGTAADGAKVADDLDPLTGLPVVSLYGKSLRPTRESLEDLDAIVYDIPDVGARFYTYIWTLSHVMEAAAEAGKPVYVLDRPNPIGGDFSAIEGPGLDEENCSSFVGRWDIPVRYSLTIGELARLWNFEKKIGCELHVVECSGWRREMHWPETGLPFVKMSPAMSSYETALFYPGTCLIEGTTLSEGRGTDGPFRMIGAPWVDGDAVADAMNALKFPGLKVRATEFVPAGRKYAGEKCRGVMLETTDAKSLRPVAVGLHLIAALIRLHRKDFQWLPYPTAANEKGHQHFDRLIGRMYVRTMLDCGEERIAEWTGAPGWADRARRHLLYE
ncbi:MAG: hypothetical protein QOE14_401 [Humisphaera sp.]|nr:hypothetical protein [Humisphaera sp.]